ncbi:MAG: S8 family serine peptidase [Kiritimatiellia bacterium]
MTREVLVQASDAGAARAAARAAGLEFASAPVSAPGCQVFLAASAPEALVAAADLRDAGVTAEPILARQYARRAMPNDPLVGAQWHLKYQGQSGALAGTDINVESVWNYPGAGLRGAGIRIGIIDDGLETAHPDLAANVDTVNDHDWDDATPDTPDPSTDDDHGTACAGNAAARGNNGVGVSGSAPEATLVGLRLISAAVGDTEEGEALGWLPGLVQVKSNSWGPNDDAVTLEGPGTLASAALKAGAETGRGGRGTIYLWAAGNGGDVLDDSNYDGYANSIYTIAVAALDSQSRQSWYSEPGANVVVTAPSNGDTPALGITTTDRSGSVGYNSGSTSGEISGQPNYTQTFGGTSSATPTAAGVAALILQANPNLGWRDVQEVLMASATKVNPSDSDWTTNGGGFHVNHKFGAGLINAAAAVALAQTWTNLGAHRTNTVAQSTSTAIPDNSATGVTRTFDLSSTNLRVEHVVVQLTVSSVPKGQLEITLTSPAGTVSRLCEKHGDTTNRLTAWRFMTVRNWGESSTGTWTLKVADRTAGTTGSLTSATLTVYGADATPVNPPPQVTLTAPAAGAVFSPGATVTLAATATDLALGGGPGSVSRVEFFAGATSLGVDPDAPYTLDWVPPANGAYTLQARATDSEGAEGRSATVSIQVVDQPPVITAGGLSQTDPAYSDTALDVTGLVATDPEGQSLTFAHQWQYSLNGTAWTDAPGAASATLAPAAANGAKLWRCRVTAHDGTSASAPWYAGPVALQSRPVTTGTAASPGPMPSRLTCGRPTPLSSARRSSTSSARLQRRRVGEILTLKSGSLRNFTLTDTQGGRCLRRLRVVGRHPRRDAHRRVQRRDARSAPARRRHRSERRRPHGARLLVRVFHRVLARPRQQRGQSAPARRRERRGQPGRLRQQHHRDAQHRAGRLGQGRVLRGRHGGRRERRGQLARGVWHGGAEGGPGGPRRGLAPHRVRRAVDGAAGGVHRFGTGHAVLRLARRRHRRRLRQIRYHGRQPHH